jgi:hypothetical protein
MFIVDVKLALLADYANITREGKLNVMGIFADINAPILPWIHPQLQIVLQLEASAAEWDTEKNIEIKLLDKDAKQIICISGNLKIPRGQPGRRVNINSQMVFNNLKFETTGDYVFAVLIGGETKQEIPLKVNYVPQPQQPPPSPHD